MDLNEYIRQSYKRPNRRVLETLGASEDLIEYLMETPGNTNMQIVESIGEGKSKIELPYTFHFETREVEYNGETIQLSICTEHDKWIEIWNSFGNGQIPMLEISNCKSIETEELNSLGEIEEFSVVDFSYYFNTNLFEGSISTTESWFMEGSDNDFEYGLYDNIWGSTKAADITINSQEGYIIKILIEDDDKHSSEKNYYYIKKGESWTCDGYLYDGVNVYHKDDVITPTSDMTLTLPPVSNLSHTFHFVSYENEIACNEVDEWFNFLGALESGAVVKAILNGESFTNFVLDDPYEYIEIKKINSLGERSGEKNITWLVEDSNINTTTLYSIMYRPEYLSSHLITASFYEPFDITLKIQPGHKIIYNTIDNSEYDTDIEYCYVGVKARSWCRIRYGTWTDGTDTYKRGDIIYPTSDMILTSLR